MSNQLLGLNICFSAVMPSSGRADGLFLPCAYLLSGEGIIPIPPKGLSLSLVDAVGTGRGDASLPRQLPCLSERRYKSTHVTQAYFLFAALCA